MTKESLHRVVTLFLGCTFLLLGCGGNKVMKQQKVLTEMYKPVVMERTGANNRPEWTSEKTFLEDENSLYFSGGWMGGADYALTLRLAKAEATKNLLESIQIKTRSEFGAAMHGNNENMSDVGRYVTDAVAWVVDGLMISGIRQREIHYEQVFGPMEQSVRYNAWIQLEIAKADYRKAQIDAVQKLLNKTIQEKNQEAKDAAQELLERLRQEI